jgi:aspartate racemase
VRSEVYSRQLATRGLEAVRPSDGDRDLVARIIMDELVPGTVRPESTAQLVAVIQRLRDRGCDAVALACTELPLVLGDGNSPLPTLDSTRLLARAALDRALSAR